MNRIRSIFLHFKHLINQSIIWETSRIAQYFAKYDHQGLPNAAVRLCFLITEPEILTANIFSYFLY